MLIRIVRMQFQQDKVSQFLRLFESSKVRIRSFEGCEHLELKRDVEHTNVYYTLSHWKGPEYLEKYRNSDFFRSTWSKTKPLFEEKAKAFSLVD